MHTLLYIHHIFKPRRQTDLKNDVKKKKRPNDIDEKSIASLVAEGR